MLPRRIFIFLTLLLALLPQLHAQLQIDLRVPRRLYVAYEPIIVTVGITNLSGHDITLQDADAQKWFSFQVTTTDERIVPPADLNYQLSPLNIAAGQSVKRSVNLTTLYPVNEFGLYHLKASIYFAETQKYISSQSSSFEVTDGKMVWHQTVGVPQGVEGEGTYRNISLLTYHGEKYNMLYIRVEDREHGVVYVTNALGRLLLSQDPQVVLDRANRIHVLHLCAANTYTYSRIGLNGEWLGQSTYNVVKARPALKKLPDGSVAVAGGKLDVPANPAPGAPAPPKLSDRPPGLPKG